ncbi:hypothetical protein EMCRGX_G028794 [Ephydatia muelleri]
MLTFVQSRLCPFQPLQVEMGKAILVHPANSVFPSVVILRKPQEKHVVMVRCGDSVDLLVLLSYLNIMVTLGPPLVLMATLGPLVLLVLLGPPVLVVSLGPLVIMVTHGPLVLMVIHWSSPIHGHP